MNPMPSFVVVIVLGVASGCALNRGPDTAAVDRSAIQIGMTQRQVEDLMRPVTNEVAIDHKGNVTGMRYDTGDRFVFVDGRLQSHTRD